MKNKKINKLFICLALSTISLGVSSCSTFFEEDGYLIKDTLVTTDDETGDVKVIINFTGDNIAPLTFNVPSGLSGVNGVGIKEVTSTLEGNFVILTIKYTSNALSDTIIKIPVIKGDDGKGIASVSVDKNKEGNTVLVFTYTDGSFSDDIIIPKGEDGIGIKEITSKSSIDGSKIIITITYTDESKEDTIISLNNPNSIKSIVRDESQDTEYEHALKITYTDDTSEIILVPKPHATMWLKGENEPTNEVGVDGDFYLNKKTGDVYEKVGDKWIFIFCIKGPGSGTSLKVKFDSNGGNVDGETMPFIIIVNYGERITLQDIPTPIFEGHNFEGWWTSKTYNVNSGHFTDLTTITSDLNLYARWGNE